MAYQGEIKNFGAAKGFGFISCPDVDKDVYFQRRDLPEDLQGNFSHDFFNFQGLTAIFELTETKDGKPQARNVKVVGGEGLPMLGEVKNFSDKNGYGFITSSMWDSDLYFKGKDLPPHLQGMGLGQLKGMKVKFTTVAMPDGKMQARNLVVSAPGGMVPMARMSIAEMAMPMPMPAAPMRRPTMMSAQPMPAPTMRAGMGKGKPMPSSRPVPTMQAPPVMAPAQMSMAPVMGNAIPDGTSMVGTVKSFDPAKGFGFISAPNFPPDIYFKPDLEEVTKGQQVTFLIKWSPQGKPQAREVSIPMQEGDSYVGSVKRFNPNKGFGFLSVEGKPQDVYFKGELLPPDLQENLSGLETGTQIRFTVHLAPDGKPQAQEMVTVGGPPQGVKRPMMNAAGVSANNGAAKRMRPTPSGVPLMPAPAAFADPAGADTGERCQGTVKSYSFSKGFGFVQSPAVQGDVYFQKAALPPKFREMELQGYEVAFDLQYRPDGKPMGMNLEV
eukprot:TRINITY_DN1791_c0_g1_i3.p1 TRINITY_DN1791_c0_g1~~TRINITY_DN1791_c0_g1_i3.p1  ORF type:complete len:497 (-),score=138.86 TRINITY_DN1791_c0_g1_i3:256-1746(-)